MIAAPAALRLPSGFLTLERTRVMGILNRTPDSFYDGGQYRGLETALERARGMLAEGVDIIDVGGEKAGPGEPVSVEEELERVIPVIEGIRQESEVVLSVDTFKPEVARAAIAAGAGIINSIGGMDGPMRAVAAETGAAVVIMHIQGQPRVDHPHPIYGAVVEDVRKYLLERAHACIAAGISLDRIIIDPGPGFGKTATHDLELMRHLDTFTALPYAVLLAVSRKRFISELIGGGPREALDASLALASWGVLKGVRLIRTHDILATGRVVRMTEAILTEGADV